ncbi:natterin-3-like isoform X1 [Schistocerca serialis cubense]|uniref:natterin-3-like isoform X1 n=1 Tax=Schistocerca serialis cubense TaxID=2023355 RepID=UPI00214EB150|nr:natterin-3-like isoform X1 [Schistocerca serialis cubense]XP_049946039.1 natterin-3-like isoform X1 [Schistocerca serialis cubense]
MSCCCDCGDDPVRPGAVVHAPPPHEPGAWAAPPIAPQAPHQYPGPPQHDAGGWAPPPMAMPMPAEAPQLFPAAPVVDVQPTPCPPPTLPQPQPAAVVYPSVPLDDDDDNDSAYCWRQGNYGSIPDGAVRAGHDKDGGPIFVGRAFHEGDMLPAKVVPNKGGAYVAWGGGEHSKEEYEVLCDGDPAWVMTSGGSVPDGAVPGGTTSEGERLFIGRVMHDGAFSVGKVQPSHGVCYIPYGGEEVAYGEYEILVGR